MLTGAGFEGRQIGCCKLALRKLLKLLGKIGSGGETRTPDLGVMNPTL